MAHPGDIILVQPGTYHEEVNISKPWITIVGANQRKVILDGNFSFDTGITAYGAPGVVVRDLTVRNYRVNGVFFFKSDHWGMDHIVAIDNGEYGLFALSSRWGIINNSVAIGGGDSGFYIGETHQCDCVINNSTAYGNVVGYSGTRVDGVVIENSRFINNSVGVAPNTLLPPFALVLSGRWNHPLFASNHTIENNVIMDNNNATVQGVGISASYGVPIGTGISLAGVSGNMVRNNTITGNTRWGIAEWYFLYPPTGNTFQSNSFSKNGVDFWSDGTGFLGCGDNQSPNGDALPSCGTAPVLRLTIPNPFKEIELLLSLGHPTAEVSVIAFPALLGILPLAPVTESRSQTEAGKPALGIASRRNRTLAGLVDALVSGILYLAVVSILVTGFGSTDVYSLVDNLFAFTFLLTPLAYFLYVTIWFVYASVVGGAGRRTLGHAMFGIRLGAKDGEASARSVFLRNLIAYLGSATLGITWLVSVSARNRTLSEQLSGTYLLQCD